jgi:hypothetical protein
VKHVLATRCIHGIQRRDCRCTQIRSDQQNISLRPVRPLEAPSWRQGRSAPGLVMTCPVGTFLFKEN